MYETTRPFLFFVLLLSLCRSAFAIPVDELDPGREWQIKSLTIEGNENLSTRELHEVLVTKTRPWYAVWRPLPLFDPVTFAADLQRLRRFYQAQGHYEAEISADLETNESENTVTAHIKISEGKPVIVAEMQLEVTDYPELQPVLESHRPDLPLAVGKVMTEQAYQQTGAKIKEILLDEGRARAEVERKAQVIVDEHSADVFYRAEAGPASVFGEARVEGLKDVAPEIVTRELDYQPGERFSNKAIQTSRRNLLGLDLFSEVQINLGMLPNDSSVVPTEIRVEEKPPREIKIGIGYGTEDQLRGQVRWRHNNWLGGGRRLEVGGKASFIAREADVRFVQPHFFGRPNTFSLTFGPQQLDEPGFFLNAVRLQPRIERKFSDSVTGYLAYRVEHDRLKEISPETIQVLEEFQEKGILSGLALGFLVNTADHPLNPTRGWTLLLITEQVGSFLGGDFDFLKLQGEAKRYDPLVFKIILASRIKLGFAQPFGGRRAEVPLFERFYAGGSNSVRGYGRHRLGPLSAADDPVGGRSLVEGSLELRRELFENLGGALFLDFGQVSLRSFDPPIDNLKFAAGFGVSYATPVGPLRFDVGFPFSPPKGDRRWQIHFSVGQTF
ncbi:MAG TPA: outer membrane protein assembly factor BamA [Candidatus Binatia bacterium]|nr:outer membrane protein assembly factor BamA [Candidatus Binatia bacterium]